MEAWEALCDGCLSGISVAIPDKSDIPTSRGEVSLYRHIYTFSCAAARYAYESTRSKSFGIGS